MLELTVTAVRSEKVECETRESVNVFYKTNYRKNCRLAKHEVVSLEKELEKNNVNVVNIS